MSKDSIQHWINKSLYWTLLSIYIILLGLFATWFSFDVRNNVVPEQTALGLPKYYGSCAPLVRIVYDALLENRNITKTLHIDPNRNKILFKSKVIGSIAGAFTYSSECKDVNAIGLMLVSDANITLDAAFNQIITFNEAVPLARSYYAEAEKLGYFKSHLIQGYLLSQRISRNKFRVTIKAPF